MRHCRFCGREYKGHRCPCRKVQRGSGGGGRRWGLEQARARMLGGWDGEGDGEQGTADRMEDAAPCCPRCGAELEAVPGVPPELWRCPACVERDKSPMKIIHYGG